MHTHTDVTLKVDSSLVNSVSEWIDTVIDDAIVDTDSGEVSVSETYSIFEIDQVIDLVTAFFSKFGDVDLEINGFIDSSESAGEYQDFDGIFTNGHGTLKYSDWYVYFYPGDYDDMSDEELEQELAYDLFYKVDVDEARRVFEEYKLDCHMDNKIIVQNGNGKLFDEVPLMNEWTI